VREVVDAAGAGQFVHVVGDTPQNGHHSGGVGHDVVPAGPVRLGTQVDHRRIGFPVQVFQPVRALADPLHLVLQAPGDLSPAGQLTIVVGDVWVFRRRPARAA